MKNKYFLWLSIILFCISLILPVCLSRDNFIEYYTSNNPENLGYVYLILGYITIVELPFEFFCWLGNFTLVLSWILFQFKFSKYLIVLSFIQMLTFGIDYIFTLNVFDIIDYDFPLFGYWIWLSSSIAMFFYHFYPKRNKNLESQIV